MSVFAPFLTYFHILFYFVFGGSIIFVDLFPLFFFLQLFCLFFIPLIHILLLLLLAWLPPRFHFNGNCYVCVIIVAPMMLYVRTWLWLWGWFYPQLYPGTRSHSRISTMVNDACQKSRTHDTMTIETPVLQCSGISYLQRFDGGGGNDDQIISDVSTEVEGIYYIVSSANTVMNVRSFCKQ